MDENEEIVKNIEESKIKGKKVCFFKKKETWISLIIGIILGGAIMYLMGILGFPGLGHKTVTTFKGGRVTQSSVYKEMEKYDLFSFVLDQTQNKILEKKYKLNDEQKKEVEDSAESIISRYILYGYTEDKFFEENGFTNKKDFITYLESNYRKNLCLKDYLKSVVPHEKVEEYYNNNDIYGNIDTNHILVQVSNDVSDEQALDTAKDIIKKLNSGTSFNDVAKEYSDKIYSGEPENVIFNSLNADQLAESYVKASKKLEVGKYTKEPVKTDYGYHIIYCVSKADKPTIEKIEDDIIEKLADELNINTQYASLKSLIELGKEYKIKFADKKLQEKYDEYCKQVDDAINTNTSVEE